MYTGFPTDMVTLLRCPNDASDLEVTEPTPASHLVSAKLRCHTCLRLFLVEDGIVRLLDATALDRESQHECMLRDEQSVRYDPSVEETNWHQMEIIPTIEALGTVADKSLLEIGCGTGRYTVRLAPQARTMIAADFSLSSLRTLAGRIKPVWHIGLVQTDATRLELAPGSFDCALSTLVSNLPTADHRRQMMERIAKAIRADGRFVFSTHYYGFRDRMFVAVRSGHYRKGGIYRYLFGRREILRETRPYFRDAKCRPIQIALPLTRHLRLPARTLSRAAERIPMLNAFGELLLVEASRPAKSGA